MITKKLTTRENFILQSRLTKENILTRIAENLQPLRPFRATGSKQKNYRGEIYGNSFEICETLPLRKRDSFLPIFSGKVYSENDGSRIEIKMGPQDFTGIFILIWLTIVGLVCLVMLLVGIAMLRKTGRIAFSPMASIPFIMLVFGICLSVFGSKISSQNSKNKLIELLEAKIQ